MSDDRIEGALRSLAGQAERFGRLPEATDIYARGRARRKRRYAATATLAVLFGAGAVAAEVDDGPQTGPAAPRTSAPGATHPAASVSPTSAPPADPLLSGGREVAIVRGPGAALSLDGGFLTEAEADGDGGRQLFVLTPLGGGEYLIKAFGRRNTNHPASDEPACWQVYREAGRPPTVQGVVCDPADPDQRFTVTPQSTGRYAISNASAYLRASPAAGLILDAPHRDNFRLIDRGPARRPAGG